MAAGGGVMGRAPNTGDNALSWTDRALCRHDDPDLFFDEGAVGEALAACRTCPVRQQCLSLAMAAEGGVSQYSRFGIYGGLTPEERAALAKARAKTGQGPRKVPRWEGRAIEPCGTRAAYRRHMRHKEEPCQPCRDAERRERYARAERAKQAASAGMDAA
jgi:WhiB family redox-sensing transcriptional regulator